MESHEYTEASRRTMRTEGMSYKDQVMSATLGLTGEAGEVADSIKKAFYHGHSLDIDKMKEELGDVLFYLTWLASLHGLTLAEVMAANVAKLRRRYPDGFSTERSINRETT